MDIEFIAEAGQARGSVDEAIEIVRQFAAAGATYVKVQMLHPELIAAEDALSYWSTGPDVQQRKQFARNGVIPYPMWEMVRDECDHIGVGFCATPFDLIAVEALRTLAPDAVKIASGDITNLPLLRAVASLNKLTFLSTGASTSVEVREAIRVFRMAQGAAKARAQLIPLACTLAYPTALRDANLARIKVLQCTVPSVQDIGYSDHTVETITGMLAVIAGATVLEKHVTLDTGGGQPDDAMALGPDEFREYVRRALDAAKIAGDEDMVVEAELPARVGARRAARFSRDIPAGVSVEASMISYLRPDPHGDGRSIRIADGAPRTLRPVVAGEVLSDENVTCDRF